MTLTKDHLNVIKTNCNLNIYEVKIWTSLLSRGVSSASELADISGVPRSRCYDVLETLEKKGFVIMKIGKPIKYIAVHPNEVISRVRKSIEEDTNQTIDSLLSLKNTDIFKELQLLHRSGIEHVDPLELATSLTGKSTIHHHMKGMLERSQKEVILCLPDLGNKKKANTIKTILRRLTRKGGLVTIYSSTKKIQENTKDVGKVIPCSPAFHFVMCDTTEILFFTTNPLISPLYEHAIWIRAPFTVSAMKALLLKNCKP